MEEWWTVARMTSLAWGMYCISSGERNINRIETRYIVTYPAIVVFYPYSILLLVHAEQPSEDRGYCRRRDMAKTGPELQCG